MKLLIITQKVDKNDSVLGFFHNWIVEFAKHCEKLTVICLYKGIYDLPENVSVLSLGKENGANKLKYIYNFYKYIWKYRKDYDNVFVHMNPEYVVFGGLFWRIFHKKVCLWFVHKSTNLYLKIANILVKHIFTSSKESCNINSSKKIYMNHGIDTNLFFYKNKIKNDVFKILLVGRITEIKNQKLLIQAIDLLKRDFHFDNFVLDIVGSPVYEKDKQYLLELKEMIEKLNLSNNVCFLSNYKTSDMPTVYNSHDLSINLCPTGGMDKVVLESLACGTLVIVFNKAFSDILKNYKELFILDNESKEELSKKIFNIINLEEDKISKINLELSNYVVKNFDLKNIITKIINYYE